jgi:hypothetical protein
MTRLGRWNHDKMTVYYLFGLAIPGAFASAGFHHQPYVLDRDSVTPSLELQCIVFPGIEDAYPENSLWHAECNDIVNDVVRSGTTIAGEVLASGTFMSQQPKATRTPIDVAK